MSECKGSVLADNFKKLLGIAERAEDDVCRQIAHIASKYLRELPEFLDIHGPLEDVIVSGFRFTTILGEEGNAKISFSIASGDYVPLPEIWIIIPRDKNRDIVIGTEAENKLTRINCFQKLYKHLDSYLSKLNKSIETILKEIS